MSQASLETVSPPSADLESSPLLARIRGAGSQQHAALEAADGLEGLGLTVSAILAYLWLVFWLDNAVHFPAPAG